MERHDLLAPLVAALEAARAGGDAGFDAAFTGALPPPIDLGDGQVISEAALLLIDLALVAECRVDPRPGMAAARLVGHLVSAVCSMDQIEAIATIEPGQRAAHAALDGVLRAPPDSLLLKAMINRLTLALARATGSVEHALLFLMTTVDRSTPMGPKPPPAPDGYGC